MPSVVCSSHGDEENCHACGFNYDFPTGASLPYDPKFHRDKLSSLFFWEYGKSVVSPFFHSSPNTRQFGWQRQRCSQVCGYTHHEFGPNSPRITSPVLPSGIYLSGLFTWSQWILEVAAVGAIMLNQPALGTTANLWPWWTWRHHPSFRKLPPTIYCKDKPWWFWILLLTSRRTTIPIQLSQSV